MMADSRLSRTCRGIVPSTIIRAVISSMRSSPSSGRMRAATAGFIRDRMAATVWSCSPISQLAVVCSFTEEKDSQTFWPLVGPRSSP